VYLDQNKGFDLKKLNVVLSGREALHWENVGLLVATSFGRKMKDLVKK